MIEVLTRVFAYWRSTRKINANYDCHNSSPSAAHDVLSITQANYEEYEYRQVNPY